MKYQSRQFGKRAFADMFSPGDKVKIVKNIWRWHTEINEARKAKGKKLL